MNIIISKSPKLSKKYVASVTDGGIIKDVYFGQAGASDYTIHNDDERKQRYLNRHRKRENWEDPLTSGFWAANLLWNKKTLQESIDDINERFKNIHVRLK
jgi:hypothetical protein